MSFRLYRPEGKDYTIQRMIIGTHTSEDVQNYLQIAQVQLPTGDAAMDDKKFDEDKGKHTLLPPLNSVGLFVIVDGWRGMN